MDRRLEQARQLAALYKRQMELLETKKGLEKEAFDLEIAAHNEQVDVENLERFSLNGAFLKLTGKYEGQLEEEQREARAARTKYEFAAARLEKVNAELSHIAQELPSFTGCGEALEAALTEKLGTVPCPEEKNLLRTLQSVLRNGELVEEAGEKLRDALDTVYSWMGAGRTMASVSGGLLQAEMAAQGRLNEYKGLLALLREELEMLGYELEKEAFQEFGKQYLTELFAEVLVSSRCGKIQEQLTRIHWRWKALEPQLKTHLMQAKIDFLEALCYVGEK